MKFFSRDTSKMLKPVRIAGSVLLLALPLAGCVYEAPPPYAGPPPVAAAPPPPPYYYANPQYPPYYYGYGGPSISFGYWGGRGGYGRGYWR